MVDPLVAKKKFPFCTKSSKKSISLGNPTILSLQTIEPFEAHKNCPGQFRFHVFEFDRHILLAVALGHCASVFAFPSKYSIYPFLKNILSIF